MPKSTSDANGHNPRYIVALALAAVGILVLGFLLKPRKPPSEAAPPPISQTELQRLARLAQRRSLDTMTEHFSEVAGGLAARVVQVGAGTGSGVLWGTNLVLTAGQGASTPESTVLMTPAGHLLTITRSVAGPQLPLAAYDLPGETPLGGEAEEAGPLDAAEWILAVWHREGDLAFSPGHYLETRAASCGELAVEEVLTSLALSSEMAGGGLFDLDGALLAVILPCGGGLAALNPPSISRLIATGRSLEGQLLALYGLRTAPVTEAVRTHLKVEQGALVSETWKGHLADEAGLRPGDVIVALGEHPVASPQDLQPLLLPPELRPGVVRARRGKSTVDVDLVPRPGPPTDAEDDDDHGVRLASLSAGLVVGSVSPGSPGEDAGLRAGDRIVRVDDREPKDAAELRRVLARRRPVFIELERGPRRLGMLLE